jgi:O-antigen ligase
MISKSLIQTISFYSQKIAVACGILLGFSMPISTGLDSVLLIFILFFALIGWNKQYIDYITNNPIAKASLALFLILFIACFFGQAPLKNSFKVLKKYDELILIVLLIPIFKQQILQTYAKYSFMAAMLFTLVLSYLIWLGVFQGTSLFATRMPDNPVVFKLHITHAIFMSFAAFMFAVYAMQSAGKTRWLFVSASVLAACNVLLMTQGRTGYLVIFALAIYLILSILPKQSIMWGLGLILLASVSTYVSSPQIQSRVNLSLQEAKSWQPMQGNNQSSSIGTRLDYYSNTIKIIHKHCLFGVGTGGFEAAYAKEIAGTAVAPSSNPHNQYLLFWAQGGALGLAAFIALLALARQQAKRLVNHTDTLLAHGVIITIAVGCLFNSLLLDHAEGLFFGWFLGLLFAGLPSRERSM